MTKNSNVKIIARKYDLMIHRSWECELIAETDKYFLFKGVFDKQIEHKELGTIRAGTISFEYYYKNDFYSIFVFFDPSGEFRNYYCNTNLPPSFEQNILSYIDLDIDVLVRRDFSVEVLDTDEFDANAEKYHYPEEIRIKVFETLEMILTKISNREFPFDSDSRIYQNYQKI